MVQAADDRGRQEIEDRAKTLFPGALRRIRWLRHGDEPPLGPGAHQRADRLRAARQHTREIEALKSEF